MASSRRCFRHRLTSILLSIFLLRHVFLRRLGRNESGQFMARRLSQLGHPKLGSWLSVRVSGEEEIAANDRFFHFRRFVKSGPVRDERRGKAVPTGRKSARSNEIDSPLIPEGDPWFKWRRLALIAAVLLIVHAVCYCLLASVPKETSRLFRKRFYVILCGWKREPPPEDFHYLCI